MPKYTRLQYNPELKLIFDASDSVNSGPAQEFYMLWCYVILGRKLHEDWYELAREGDWDRQVHVWAVSPAEPRKILRIGCKRVPEHELLRIGRELDWQVDPELEHKLAYVPPISRHAKEYKIFAGTTDGRMLPIKGYAIDLPEFPGLFVHPTYHGSTQTFNPTEWSVSEARTGLSAQAYSNMGYSTKRQAARQAYKRLIGFGPEKYAEVVQKRLNEIQGQQGIPLEETT